jgi:hypothetical protein
LRVDARQAATTAYVTHFGHDYGFAVPNFEPEHELTDKRVRGQAAVRNALRRFLPRRRSDDRMREQPKTIEAYWPDIEVGDGSPVQLDLSRLNDPAEATILVAAQERR